MHTAFHKFSLSSSSSLLPLPYALSSLLSIIFSCRKGGGEAERTGAGGEKKGAGGQRREGEQWEERRERRGEDRNYGEGEGGAERS